MKVLILQENGRHEANREFRESQCLNRAFKSLGVESEVWGKGHDNFSSEPDYESYGLIVNLENYDFSGWVPNLQKVQTKKFLWSIDAHLKGPQSDLDEADRGNYDLILQAVPQFASQRGSVFFPSCYDDSLLSPLDIEKSVDIGFCGNLINRGGLIGAIAQQHDIKQDIFVIGDAMVKAINSYKIHFNANISIDVNFRNFETIGCGTCLLTSVHPAYDNLGFIDGKNCLIYDSIDSMLDKINETLKDDEKRTRIAAEGLKLARRHTFKERAKQVLALLQGAD
jgi:hypothetical protein